MPSGHALYESLQTLNRRLFISIQKIVLCVSATFLVATLLTPTGHKETAQIKAPVVGKFEKIELALEKPTTVELAVVKIPTSPASSGSDIETIVRHAARKYGLNEDHFVGIAKCESGLNPNAVNYGYNENGYPSGLFQHLSGYWPNRAAKHGYAGASVFDAEANANVTAAMFAEGSQGLWECK